MKLPHTPVGEIGVAWLLIESRCRSNDFGPGVSARTADALWMLARQWQVGEFMGDDAASPISVTLEHESQTLDSLRLGTSVREQSLGEGTGPLEMLVERERPALDWRTRIQIGQRFERLVKSYVGTSAATMIQSLRKIYPVNAPTDAESMDRATQRFVRFLAGRVIDGGALLSAIDEGKLAADLEHNGMKEEEKQKIIDVIDDLTHWYANLCSLPESTRPKSWIPRKLDYQFSVSLSAPSSANGGPKTRIAAPDYRNGDLDWYSFIHDGPAQGHWETKPGITRTPARIEITGTSSRWWAFEDGATDFGNLDVAKPDLAKLLLMDFVLIYGDDWFSVPVPVEAGSLSRIKYLTVTNVFGETHQVPPGRRLNADPLKRFEMYSLSLSDEDTDVPPMLFVPPAAGFRQESQPVEEIRFMRDEGANMVWAVEATISNGIGNPVDGGEAQLERVQRRYEGEIAALKVAIGQLDAALTRPLSDAERSKLLTERQVKLDRIDLLSRGPTAQPPVKYGDIPRYRLATTVPENWFPFIPVQCGTPEDPCIRLRVAEMLRNKDDELPTDIPAMSKLLEHDPLLWVDEETIPRAGLRVIHTKQRIRWFDGKTYVWLGRKVLTGRGEGNSGLQFDRLMHGSE